MKGASAIRPFGLRLPPDMKEWLKNQAVKNGRSQNSEVVALLKKEKEACEQQPRGA
jgi:hypothetical protein